VTSQLSEGFLVDSAVDLKQNGPVNGRRSALDVREIGTEAAWDACEDDWRRLTGAPGSRATVFQSWDWARTWWKHYGQGRRLWLLEFSDNGAVVGYAALFLPCRFFPFRTLRFVGTGPSDYNDLVALPGRETDVVRAFWAFLADRGRAWDWLDAQQIRPGGVLAESDAGYVRAARWPGETCPFVALPDSWDGFRATLGKKMRSNVGYYDRALAKLFEVEVGLATPETLTDDLDAFFELHQRRWNRRWLPGAFAARSARAFHADVAARLLAAGALRLHKLRLDGEIQAALYCFQFNGRCAYYLGGFEPSLARLSVGTVLTARAIRHAIEEDHAAEFDFLRGDEPYKYKWSARDRHSSRISATHGGARGPLLAGGGRAALGAELGLKHWMHRRHGGKA